MKLNLKSVVLSIASLVAVSPIVLSANPASAQVLNSLGRGNMEGSYIGGGLSVGVNNPDDGSSVGGNVQARLDVPRIPVSLRGAALFANDGTALMPLATVDIGIADNTNLYAGGGYSFVDGSGVSPLGDDDGVVLTTGVETAVHRNIVLYGDVKVGFDTFKDNSDAAVAFQVGAGYRF